jgi:hypothetical protein
VLRPGTRRTPLLRDVRIGFEQHVSRAGRHVEQVVDHAIAVHVVLEHPAVGLAAAAFVEQAEVGGVVLEEVVAIAEIGTEAVTNGVVGLTGDFFIGLEDRVVVPVGRGLRTGQRIDFGGVGVGVGHLPTPVLGHRLAQRQGQLLAFTLVGRQRIGDDVHTAGTIAAVLH